MLDSNREAAADRLLCFFFSFLFFFEVLHISQMVLVFGSNITVSFPTLITVHSMRKHPVTNKGQMIKPDAICNTVALQNMQP